jgi:hypothetical protein
VAPAAGVVAPNGRAPVYLRSIVKLNRDEAANGTLEYSRTPIGTFDVTQH